jgi:MFS family permease
MSTPTAPEGAVGDAGNGLILRVQAKRAEVDRFLRATGARRRRLVNVTIVAGTIATALTAAPALGGKPLADWLTETFALSSPSWRILCAVAAVCSLAAAVATQLHTSKNYEEHIVRAQGIRATLEVLEVAIASDHLSQHEATSQYLECVENTSFIEAVR